MTLPAMRDLIDQHFTAEELRQLCFDLGIEYENLPGDTRIAKSQALVAYCLRHNRLPQLGAQCRRLRPDAAWPDLDVLAVELEKVQEALAAQEELAGILPDDQLAGILASLRQKEAGLLAQLTGSGAVTQGAGSHSVGERGVLVEGDVGGSSITGDQSSVGGIRAKRIKAENVVQGLQQLGGDLTGTAAAVALAEALRGGSITADSIEAKNVVAGFQYIADPSQATPDELRREVAALQEQLAAAIASGDLQVDAEIEDAQEALVKAETELAGDQPRGNRVVRRLKEAAELLTEGAKTTDAARQAGQALVKLAPVAAALYQIATNLFGG